MGVDFDIKVEAQGDFNQIAKEVEKDLQRQLYESTVAKVHDAVVSESREVLQRHIRDDVYGMYQPQGELHYIRRSDKTGLGTSLLESADEKHAKSIFQLKSGGVWESGIRYEPTGEHANFEWSDPDLEPDRLIGRIEKKDPPYNFEPKKRKVPKRPFWQNFVEEMIEGGQFAQTVEKILKEQGIAEPGDTITGVTRDESDGNY